MVCENIFTAPPSHYWFKSYGNFAETSEYFLLDKVVKLVGGGSVINGSYPVYFLRILIIKVKEIYISAIKEYKVFSILPTHWPTVPL